MSYEKKIFKANNDFNVDTKHFGIICNTGYIKHIDEHIKITVLSAAN